MPLERLLDYLKTSRGFDFTAYKRTTLGRRIDKRMQTVGVETHTDYQDYLEVHQNEFQELFNTILINVTSFFRDAEAWEYIERSVVPAILAAKPNDEPLRVWCAGCASGEEACSIAMLLAETLGPENFRRRVKIYATDLDDDALNCSRSGSYTPRDLERVPEPMRARYFERVGERFVFDRDLRRSVIFGRHDLVNDAPISRIDLLLCRNTLMYFNAEVQDRIVQRFHFGLNDGGYLFLGKAETMLSHSNLFSTVDLRYRLFAKVARDRVRDRGFMFAVNSSETLRAENGQARLRDAVFENNLNAQLILDVAGQLVLANDRARSLFGISRRDLGTPFQDLDISFRPVELRSGVELARRQRRIVRHEEATWTSPNGEAHVFNVTIAVLRDESGNDLGTGILFEDVTLLNRTQGELQGIRQELETAYEEVQSTNEELQTTNEELQSTVEELETTNEELQSTNEETETMNEELQSANEELETMNDELRLRSDELNRANAFMGSVLSSLRDGVIVLDGELQVLAWNYQSEELWGLRADEVLGKHLLNLDIGFPTDELRNLIRACVASGEPQRTDVDATSRRGRGLRCAVDFIPLRAPYDEGRGVILVTTCIPASVAVESA